MKENAIYTIGYGNRSIEDFINILQRLDIQYLIDVRSKPYANFNLSFNQPALKLALQKKGITYVFLGHLLGGRPDAPACYDEAGKIDYQRVEKQVFFQKGLMRLKKAYELQLKVVLMCCEINPVSCHRTKLVAEALEKQQLKVLHIGKKGRLKTHPAVMSTVISSSNLLKIEWLNHNE